MPTLQWTPRRTTLFLARVLVVVGTATVLGMLLAVASGAAAFSMAADILELPLDEGIDVVGTAGIVFGAGSALAAGLGFLLRSTAGALISVFLLVLLLPLALPQFPYEWMLDLASVLPGTGAIFLLTGESIGDGHDPHLGDRHHGRVGGRRAGPRLAPAGARRRESLRAGCRFRAASVRQSGGGPHGAARTGGAP